MRSSPATGAETALDFIAYSTSREFYSVLIDVLDEIDQPGKDNVELCLLRALGAIRDFRALKQTSSGTGATVERQLSEAQSVVLQKLISIYEREDDLPEAERYLRQLEVFEPGSSSRLAQSLGSTSKRLQTVIGTLAIPDKYVRSLHLANNEPFPPLHRAMHDRNDNVIRHFFARPQYALQQVDLLKRNTVHIVAETSNPDLLDLITHETNGLLKDRDTNSKTPLCLAAEVGNLEVFKRMIGRGSDPNARTSSSRSVLSVACAAGHLPIVKFLLEDLHVFPNDDPLHVCSPLHAAASRGNFDVCKILLEHDAWVEWLCQGQTASMLAEAHGHRAIVELIAEYAQRPGNQLPQDKSELYCDPAVTYKPPIQVSTPARPIQGLCSPPPSYHKTTPGPFQVTVDPMGLETNWDMLNEPP